MSTIITGNFEQQESAAQAVSQLAEAGFAAEAISRFAVHPAPGVVSSTEQPVEAAPEADMTAVGAVSGAAIGGAIGLVGIVALGPAAPVVGACVGSLCGAMLRSDDGPAHAHAPEAGIDDGQEPSATRKAGTLVAVVAPEDIQQDDAILILQTQGATDIDRSEGTIVNGRWTDFDRTAPLHPVSPAWPGVTTEQEQGS